MDWIQDHASVIGMAALLFFFFFFLGVIGWVFRPGSRKKYKTWSKNILKEDR